MASKKKPKNFTGADRYEDALQRAIKKALWLPEGNDKTVYRKDLAPLKPQNKPYRKKNFAPMKPFDPTLPPEVKNGFVTRNRKKNNGSQKA